jgi:hypothetical protein
MALPYKKPVAEVFKGIVTRDSENKSVLNESALAIYLWFLPCFGKINKVAQ